MSTSVPPPGYVPPASYESTMPEASPPPASTMTSRPRRPVLIGGVLGILVIVGAWFALSGSAGSPLNGEIAQAAAVSDQAPGYRMNMSVDMSMPGVSVPITASGGGVLDQRDHAASMSMAIDFSQLPQAAQVLGTTTMQISAILEGSSVYVGFPSALAAKIPSFGGRRWVKLDVGRLTGVPGLSSLTSNPTMTDPGQMLRYLRAASDGVTDDGPQQVDGIQTTHYQAQLSLDRVSGAVPPAEQSAVRQALSRLEQMTQLHDFPVDVWIDAHHLVRRIAMSMTIGIPGGRAIHETVTGDITDYGPQPRPTPPPADEVTDLSSLVGGTGNLGFG